MVNLLFFLDLVDCDNNIDGFNFYRSTQMQLEETEKDGMRAKCIPRKPKSMLASKKESNFIINSCNNGSSNGQQGGSKRLEA